MNSNLEIPGPSGLASNAPGVQVNLPGGTTHVVFGVEGTPPAGRTDDGPLRSGVSNGGVLRLNADGSMEEHGAITRVMINREWDPALGVLASARSSGGSRTAPITMQSVVTIPGVGPTSVANAVQLGFLRRDGAHGFADTGKSGEQFAQEVNAGQSSGNTSGDRQSVPLLPEAEQAMEQVASSLPFGMCDGFIAVALTQGAEAATRQYSMHATMDAGSLRQTAQFIGAAYEAHLAHDLSKQGIDVQEFASWCQRNAKGQFNAAKLTHAHSRSTAAYAPLVSDYLSRTMPSPDVLADRGVRTRTVGGVAQVFIDGAGWVSQAAASRARLV